MLSTTYPKAKKVIEKALKEWTCVTGIDWVLGSDISTPLSYSDGICQVSLTNNASDPALMATYVDQNPCGTSFLRRFYLNSFDIIINSAYLYDFDTLGNVDNNKYDFYHLFLHELGHAHILDHANREDVDLMFFSSDKGPRQFIGRLNVKNSTETQIAGDYIINNLVGPISNCSGQHILSYPNHCKKTSGIFGSDEDISQIRVYPNPISSNNQLSIDLSSLKTTDELQFTI